MNLSAPDYKSLYILQDKVIRLLGKHLGDFYLTGGTALGRFYLDHRYSDILDFFVNNHPDFQKKTNEIFGILQSVFRIDESVTLITPEYVRFVIVDDDNLKLEFVNDIAYRWGESIETEFLQIDNPANILANKLTAILSRDEPKDIFDMLTLAETYQFNWKEIYIHAFKKQIITEVDVSMRLESFPVELMADHYWLKQPVNQENFKEKLEIICDDFLFAKDNSLGIGKTLITDAKPVIFR